MLKPNLHRFFKYTCNGKYSEKDINRFISKIDTTPGLGPSGDCWLWRGILNDDGYGKFYFNSKYHRAHRVSWELFRNQLIPDGKFILHRCDNPKCIKISHLFIGTNQDNVDDRENKGRGNQISGENHCLSKLTWTNVRQIRRLWLTGKYNYKQLARIFNVTSANIGYIVRNKTWIKNKQCL